MLPAKASHGGWATAVPSPTQHPAPILNTSSCQRKNTAGPSNGRAIDICASDDAAAMPYKVEGQLAWLFVAFLGAMLGQVAFFHGVPIGGQEQHKQANRAEDERHHAQQRFSAWNQHL
jgi:hypothetical protein